MYALRRCPPQGSLDWPRPDTNSVEAYSARNLKWYQAWMKKTGKQKSRGKTEL